MLSGTLVIIFSPGIYTITALALTSGPTASVIAVQTLTVFTNNLAPVVSVTVPTQMLNCTTPQVQLVGSSTTNFVNYSWISPGKPSINSSTLHVNTVVSVPTNTFLGDFTLTVTDPKTGCKTTTVIPFYQNIFPSKAQITSFYGTSPCICTPSINLANNSTTGIPWNSALFGTVTPQPVVSSWSRSFSPGTSTLSSSYNTGAVGIYTMTAKDLNNGCTCDLLIGPCTALNEMNNTNNALNIYPNPSQGHFIIKLKQEIDLKGSEIRLYNSVGLLVRSLPVANESTSLDLHNETSGIYFISVFKDNKPHFTQKVIKQ